MRIEQVMRPPRGADRIPMFDRGNRRTGEFAFLRRFMPLLLLTVGGIANPAARAGMSYAIVDYPTITSPYTVSGTITTNGATGTQLPTSDITGWDITVRKGTSLIFELTTSNSINLPSTFDATTTALSVGTAEGEGVDFVNIQTGNNVAWATPPNTTQQVEYVAHQGVLPHQTTLFSGFLPSFQSPVATASAVPEPSTTVLTGIGAGTVIACVLVRKRREQRRQAAA